MNPRYESASISDEAATLIVQGARDAARELGTPMTIAVVDGAGQLKAFARMDGAPAMTIQVAIDKAYTAAGFGRASHVWDEVLENDAVLGRGARSGIDRLVTFGGGFPIVVEGLIGGIGVSGGHYSQDMQVAEAALAVLSR